MVSGVNTLKVDLVDKMGSDLTVVNAARVSFAKKSDWDHSIPFAEGNVLKDSDARLIKYLAKHNHWSPFAHASLQFRIKAPIFVARQLVKHQVGLVWNGMKYPDDMLIPNQSSMFRKSGEKDHQTVSNKGQMSRIRSHMVSKVR